MTWASLCLGSWRSRPRKARKRKRTPQKTPRAAFTSCILNDVADSAYVTNLPLTLGLSLCLDAKEERLFRLVRPALAEEKARPATLTDTAFLEGCSLRVAEIAGLPLATLQELRRHPLGQELRRLVRVNAPIEAVRGAARRFFASIEHKVVPVDQRPLPRVDLLAAVAAKRTVDLSLLEKHARFIVSRGDPLPPTFDIPALRFPGVMLNVPDNRPSSTGAPVMLRSGAKRNQDATLTIFVL